MFFAEKGNGAYLNNSRIRVSKKNRIGDSILITGDLQFSKIKNKIFSAVFKCFKKSFKR